MKKWSIILGLLAVTGAAACAGGGAFLVLYNALEAQPGAQPEPAVWHEPTEVVRIDTGGRAEPEPMPMPVPEPTSEVRVTSDGPHPNVDIGLLSGADWSSCSEEHGTVSILAALTGDGTLSVTLVTSQPTTGNTSLEQCVREVVMGISTAGAPADYFMMIAEVTL